MTRAEDATSTYTSEAPTTAPTDGPLTCPEGWFNADYLGCFYFDNSNPDRNLNWVEALDACENLGGYLAEIQTQRQADLIVSKKHNNLRSVRLKCLISSHSLLCQNPVICCHSPTLTQNNSA